MVKWEDIISRVPKADRLHLRMGSMSRAYSYALSKGWITPAEVEEARQHYGSRQFDYAGD